MAVKDQKNASGKRGQKRAALGGGNGFGRTEMEEGKGSETMAATIVKDQEELREVRFVFRGNSARSVKLAGTFTNWEQNAIELERTGEEEWSTVVRLIRGEYQYKFLVDGEWRNDPNAEAEVWSDMGTTNSWMSIE